MDQESSHLQDERTSRSLGQDLESDRSEESPRPRGITLVLGGGGARGLAHFGVLTVLEREGIHVESLVGNSAGALAAAVYLQCASAVEARDRVLEFLASPAFRRHGLSFQLSQASDAPPPTVVSRLLSGWRRQVAMHLLFRRRSLFHSRRLRAVLSSMVEEGRLEDLRRPLRVVALDLEDGDEVVLQSGDLVEALLASCSVPGFFPPVDLDGRLLIDAGQADNLPVQVGLEFGQRPVVAVNLGAQIDRRRDFATGIELMMRAEEIGSRWNTRLRLQDADVHIAPELLGRYWLDFSDARSAVEAGERAAENVLEDLRRVVAEVNS